MLLVEDEELIAGSLISNLEMRGAEVVWVANGQAALDWLAENAEECEVVLSDHGMVGLTGMDLLTQIRARYPSLRRVLLSGWGAHLPRDVDTSAAERILSKPVPIEELASVLAGLRPSSG